MGLRATYYLLPTTYYGLYTCYTYYTHYTRYTHYTYYTYCTYYTYYMQDRHYISHNVWPHGSHKKIATCFLDPKLTLETDAAVCGSI